MQSILGRKSKIIIPEDIRKEYLQLKKDTLKQAKPKA